jgi:hypothetical protein
VRLPVCVRVCTSALVRRCWYVQVITDMECLSGSETLLVEAVGGGSYKLIVCPHKSGTFLGTIGFMSEAGQYAWFSVEVKASEPPPVEDIQVASALNNLVRVRGSKVQC